MVNSTSWRIDQMHVRSTSVLLSARRMSLVLASALVIGAASQGRVLADTPQPPDQAWPGEVTNGLSVSQAVPAPVTDPGSEQARFISTLASNLGISQDKL